MADERPSPPTTVAVITSLATGNPGTVFDQRDAALRAASLVDDPVARERILRVYERTRIDKRYLAIDPTTPEFLAFSSRSGTIRERMNLYFEHAVPLAVDVAARAIAGLADPTSDIRLVVFVTSTGFIAPGVDVAVIKRLGLAPSVNRVVVNFMGCAAAVNGLRSATDYVRAHPDRSALVVCLELSSVNAVFGDDVVEVVTHSLFGDGCGAMVVGACEVGHELPAGQVVVRDTFSQLLPDTEDGIVLGVNDDGITCELAQELPDYIYRGVGSAIDEALSRSELYRDDIAQWAIHPGGPAILEQSARSLGIGEERSRASWDVLAEYGNMLSVALVFVLEKLIAETAPDDGADASQPSTGVAFSFAPGVTLEGILFDVVR
ncbi:type III polyketide synthase [Gordonia sp. HY002]|uniref:type III polyketide synthase n=1 Tax=Gordonia zhenghanii TaxID=2911516 RepID=UPI001EF0A026|nr:type III polyketide synthase [Gordonia zhenghanii]MCF8571774.1 type III polyketide synthase [Gordonia zhenghanii]MCF8604786.1 type III polyketide synthase [Gordonia zhenghanii]